MKFHLVYRNNGRYNPVLGDREPRIDSIDQEISGQTSQPTEVYLGLPRFLETTNLTERETDKFSTSPSAKQFQPFSTELYNEYLHGNIPNSYHNLFDDYTITNANSETKFKLPISEQYDPEGKKFDGRQTEDRIIKKIWEMKIKRNFVEKKETVENNKSQLEIKTEPTTFNTENNKYENKDFNNKVCNNTESIQSTANNIVSESIDKAITVAQEIFKEINTESIELCTPPLSQLNILQDNISSKKLLREEADILPKSVNESVQHYERIGTDCRMNNLQKENNLKDERKLYLMQEIDESIEVGSVRRKSVKFENEAEKLFRFYKSEEFSNDETVSKNSCHLKNKTINIQARTEFVGNMKSKRILAQRKAFLVGSQMIPHICKIAESSHVHSSLIKLFYFYLLNFILAFFRYILIQLSMQSNSYFYKNCNSNQNDVNILKQHLDEKHLSSACGENDTEALILKKKKLSGSEMAQMSLRKPEELTQIMDTVISEFHTKLNIGGSHYTLRLCNKMSENSSDIEEVEIKETDPFEWLTKMDSEEREQIKKEIKLATIQAARRVSESRETFDHHVTSYNDYWRFKSEPTDSLTYIAIVESHVFTNRNLISDKYFSSSNEEVTQNSEFTGSNNVVSAISERSKSIDIKSSMVLPDVIRTDYVATVNVEHKKFPIVSDENEDESIISEVKQSIDEGIEVQAGRKTATTKITSTLENSETKQSYNSLIKQEATERTLELHELKPIKTIESTVTNTNVLQAKESLEISELKATQIIDQDTATQITTQIETASGNKTEHINVKEEVAAPVIEIKEVSKFQALNKATARQTSVIFEDIQNNTITITNVAEDTPYFSLEAEELSKAQALCKETVFDVSNCNRTELLNEAAMHYFSVYFEENDYFSINKIVEEVAIIYFQAMELVRVYSVCTPVAMHITIHFDEVESINLDKFEIEKANISEENREFSKTFCIVYATSEDISTDTEETLSFKTVDTRNVLATISYEPQVLVTVNSVATPLIRQLSNNYIDVEFMENERFQEENAECSEEIRESPLVFSMCTAISHSLKIDAEESHEFKVDEVKEEFSSICVEPQILITAFPLCTSLIRHTGTIYNEVQCIESEIIQEEKAESCIVKEIFTTAKGICTAFAQNIITNLMEINLYEVEKIKAEQGFGCIEPNIFEKVLSVGTSTAMQINVNYIEVAFKEPDMFKEEVALSSLEMKKFVRTHPMCQAVAEQITTIFEETKTMSLNYEITEEYAKIVDVPYHLISTLSIGIACASQITLDSEMTEHLECSDIREEQIPISIQEHELKNAVAVLTAVANNEYTDFYSVQENNSINFYCDKQLALLKSEPNFLNFALPFNNATVQQASFTYENYETQVVEYPVKYEQAEMIKETTHFTNAETLNKAVVSNSDDIYLLFKTNKDEILKESAAIHLESSSYSESSLNEILSSAVIKKNNVGSSEIVNVSENQRIKEKIKGDNEEAFSEKDSYLNVSVVQNVEREESQKYQQLSCELSLSKTVRESASGNVKETILMSGTDDIKSQDFQTDLIQTAEHKFENCTDIVIQDITEIDNSSDDSDETQLKKDISTAKLQKTSDKDFKAQTTQICNISEKSQDVISTKNLSGLVKAETATDESAALTIIKKEEHEPVCSVVEMYEEEDLTCSKLINTAAFSKSVSGLSHNEHSFALKETDEQLLRTNTFKSQALRSSSELESTVRGLTNIELNLLESLLIQPSNGGSTYKKSSRDSVSQSTLKPSILSYSDSQESTKSAKNCKLFLETDSNQDKFAETQKCIQNVENITDIQSPTTPPTPITDEYIFRLVVPLPKSRGTTPVSRDQSPEIIESEHDKDPHKEKKNLIPKVETKISEGVLYNPPLPNPSKSPPNSSVYTKPGLNGGAKRLPRYVKLGLRGGSDTPPITKEDILEVQRKSSILTSAITETLKNIEEYKKEFGILKKQGTDEHGLPNIRLESEETMNNISEGKMETYVSVHQTKSNADILDSVIEKEEIEKENFNVAEETDKTITISVELSNVETKVQNSDKRRKSYEEAFEDIILEDGYSSMQIGDENQSETNITSKNEDTNEIGIVNSVTKVAQSDIDRTDECNISKELVCLDMFKNKSNSAESIVEHPTEGALLKVVSNNKAYNKDDEGIVTEITKDFKTVKIEIDQSMFDGKEMKPCGDGVYKMPDEDTTTIKEYIVDEIQSDDIAADQEVADVTEKTMDTDRSISPERSPALTPKEGKLLKDDHVISLTRVLSAHMLREELSPDCSKMNIRNETQQKSVDNEPIDKEQDTIKEEKKEIKWTTFLQKSHPVPVQTLGHFTDLQNKFEIQDFNASPLPWQERALADSLGARGLQIEEPILIPEEEPEYLIAVPPGFCGTSDTEATDLPLTPPIQHEIPRIEVMEDEHEAEKYSKEEKIKVEEIVKDALKIVDSLARDSENNELVQILLTKIKSITDSTAPIEERLSQMKSQLETLAQVPNVVKETLDNINERLYQIGHQKKEETIPHTEYIDQYLDSPAPNPHKSEGIEVTVEERTEPQTKEVEVTANNVLEKMPSETSASLTVTGDDDKKNNSDRIEAQSQAIQKTPLRKPQPKFGRLNPEGRSLILPGGRRWRRPGEEYNEEKIAETILAQSEIIQGKTLGINFLKYEKPPVPLDHLQRSEVYKLVHNMEQAPPRRVELLRTVISEADYREKCRSPSPHPAESHTEPSSTISQQFHP